MSEQEQLKLDDFISEEERERLISELHRFLVWVGEQLPDIVEVNGETVKLRDLVWRCIHKKQPSMQEKERIMDLIRILETKEKYDEEALRRANLTREEAKRLYHESAAFIRAIMDLRECEAGRIKLKESSEEIRQKINDARKWLDFLKNVGKRSE